MAKETRRKAKQQKKNNAPLMWGIILLVVLGAATIWFTSQSSATTSYPSEISVTDAVAKREAGAFILDVRQQEEWNEFHIPESTLIPLDQLASRLNELPKDQEIVIVCRSGNRSAQARDLLLGEGFTRVTSMAGGLNQWKSAGYPTVSGP